MKLKDYEYIIDSITPSFWFEEGMDKEEYFVDSQNLYCIKFANFPNNEGKEDDRKWWIISPYKPKGMKINETNKHLIKWLVEDCYKENMCGDECEYEFYEWDFKNHCIKED